MNEFTPMGSVFHNSTNVLHFLKTSVVSQGIDIMSSLVSLFWHVHVGASTGLPSVALALDVIEHDL